MYRSTSTSIGLKWKPPNMNNGLAVGFKVFRNNGLGTPISSTPDPTCGMDRSPAPQNCALKGLIPSETYQIQMVATNDLGDSTPSAIVEMYASTVPETITFATSQET